MSFRKQTYRGICLSLALSLASLASLFAPFLPSATAAPAAAASGTRFGIDEGYVAPDVFRRSGATWDRVNIYWNAYQPEGPTDWKGNALSTDADLARDKAAGIEVVGVITNPPAWATRNGSVPLNLDLPYNDPKNYWGAFVSRLAKTYAGTIDSWIIWNEPDFDPQHYSLSSWAGTEDEFYLLNKVAHQAVHAANPRGRTVFAGTTYWADHLLNRKLFLDRVLDAANRIDPQAAQHGYYFDAVDIHIYSSSSQVLTIPQEYREVLRRYGVAKPIWISELNVVPWDDPASKVPRGGHRASLTEQAAYVIQALALARVAEVERAAVYKLIDGTILGGEPYGLVRNDNSERPAYKAFQMATRFLTLPGTVSYESRGGATIVTIDAGKQRVTVAWSTKPTAIDLPIMPRGTSAQLATKLGQVTNLALPRDPAQPNYVLHLGAATANTNDGNADDYIIGGDPLILFEDGIGEGIMLGSTLYFPLTGFGVSGAFLDYFQHRGDLRTFGYPISRPFTLQGRQVQFFQRRVLQLQPDGTVGQLNLLDAEYMPYTQINNATFPSADLNLTRKLPAPNSPDYLAKIFEYIQAAAPDQWNGMAVNFGATFSRTVSLSEAFPDGKGNPALLPGINLELWGVPTSAPTLDPANHNFVYQRFQRGVMHYDKATGATQALLLADYLKAIMTGQKLPPDLAAAAQDSRFFKQYDPSKPKWVARPSQLPDTDLTNAFERQPVP